MIRTFNCLNVRVYMIRLDLLFCHANVQLLAVISLLHIGGVQLSRIAFLEAFQQDIYQNAWLRNDHDISIEILIASINYVCYACYTHRFSLVRDFYSFYTAIWFQRALLLILYRQFGFKSLSY